MYRNLFISSNSTKTWINLYFIQMLQTYNDMDEKPFKVSEGDEADQ